MTWRTADTAPKDGTHILTCYSAERVMTARGVEVLMNDDSHRIYAWQDGGWFNGEFVEQEGRRRASV